MCETLMLTCSKCKQTKGIQLFPMCQRKSKWPHCTKCRYERDKKYRISNPVPADYGMRTKTGRCLWPK